MEYYLVRDPVHLVARIGARHSVISLRVVPGHVFYSHARVYTHTRTQHATHTHASLLILL